MPEAIWANLPFEEAIKYFQDKVDLPTETWRDLWEGMHSRAFVVAGAMKSELLSDLRTAIDKAISEGTTIADFRKAFDATVQKNGWSYKGSRGWRTGVIFNTNLRTAYAAGHYSQMTDTDVLKARPYWRYSAVLDGRTRPLHRQWNGTILPATDPWWDTHYPPNGWGCRCTVVSVSETEMARDGLKVSARPDDGTYEWVNKDTGVIETIPKGIDPGWAYNPGKTAWGEKLSENVMDEWRAKKADAWKSLTPGNWETAGQPARIPLDKAKVSLDYHIGKTPEAMQAAIKEVMGVEDKTFSFKSGDFSYDVLVNAKTLADHIDVNRAAYIPFLPETLEDPYEIWLSFEQHMGTGKVILRQRIIKAIETGNKEGMLVVTNTVNGMMEAWTFVPTSDLDYLNRQRVGLLIWKRD